MCLKRTSQSNPAEAVCSKRIKIEKQSDDLIQQDQQSGQFASNFTTLYTAALALQLQQQQQQQQQHQTGAVNQIQDLSNYFAKFPIGLLQSQFNLNANNVPNVNSKMKSDENQQQQHELLQLNLKSQEDLNAKLKFLTSQQALNLAECGSAPQKNERQPPLLGNGEDNMEETDFDDDEDDEAAVKHETNSNLDDNNIEAGVHQFEEEEDEMDDSNESSQTSSSNSASSDNECKKSQSIKSGSSSQHYGLNAKEQTNDEENRQIL